MCIALTGPDRDLVDLLEGQIRRLDADGDDDSLQSIIKEQSQHAAEDSGDGITDGETTFAESTRKRSR